jgi:hypothetical protein
LVGGNESVTADQFRKFIAEWVLYGLFAAALIIAFPDQPWWAFALEVLAAWIAVKLEVRSYIE